MIGYPATSSKIMRCFLYFGCSLKKQEVGRVSSHMSHHRAIQLVAVDTDPHENFLLK